MPQNLMHELLLTDIQLAISLTAKARSDLSIRFLERRFHIKGRGSRYSANDDRQALEPGLGFLLAIDRNGRTHHLLFESANVALKNGKNSAHLRH